MEEIDRIITLESAKQKEIQQDAPPWNQVFQTAEQFDRADRASRIIKSESLLEFCRETILARADELIANQARSSYKTVREMPSAKVAEEPTD